MNTTVLLIRKELMYLFRNLKSTWITTLVMLFIFVVVYPTGILTAGIIGPYMLVYGVMAYEEQSHSDVLNYMLPVSYKEVCKSKYLIGLIYLFIIAVVGGSILTIGRRLVPGHYGAFKELGLWSILVISAGGALLYTAFIIPMIYKFGCIKMRTVMVLIYGGIFGISISVANILKEVPLDISDHLKSSLVGGGILIVGVVAYIISYLISLKILKNKEYTV